MAQRRVAFELARSANHVLAKFPGHSENVAYDRSAFLFRVAFNCMQAFEMQGSVDERRLQTYSALQALLLGGAQAMRTKSF